MYYTCDHCNEEKPVINPETGKSNYTQVVTGEKICRGNCYSSFKYRQTVNKGLVDENDSFNRTFEEIRNHLDTGYDCQRNQDIILHGLR